MKFFDTNRFGVSVTLREGDHVERALRIFNKKVQDAGRIKVYRSKMEYEKPTSERKRKKNTAKRRWEKFVRDMVESGQMKRDT